MGSYLAENLRRSQRDPKFLSVLRGIMEVGYGGLPIPQDAEEWAEKSGIPIRVRTTLTMFNEISIPTFAVSEHIREY
jgi:hypothetical protein